MAAPSVGRRSCAGQREAAAVISQSRRLLYGRVKRAAVRRLFFFCRRPAASTYSNNYKAVSRFKRCKAHPKLILPIAV